MNSWPDILPFGEGCKSDSRAPELLEQRLWEVCDWIILCCGSVVPLEVFMSVTLIHFDDSWLIASRLVPSQQVWDLHRGDGAC